MEMYDTPQRGNYTYRTRNFDGTFNTYYTSCDVLGESAASFLVRIMVPLGNHPARSTMTVRKHNVRLHGTTATPKRKEYDYSAAYWNK